MDFDLSDDQIALRDAATALIEARASRDRVRAHVGDGVAIGGTSAAPKGFDRELWEAMADQGWLAIERSEDKGGLGMGLVEVAVLAEVMGRHVAPAPFLPTVLAVGALDAAGETGALGAICDSMAEGSAVGCIADARDRGSVDVRRSGGTVTLTGCPEPVIYGPSSEVAVVLTADAVFAVSLNEGNRPSPEPAMDRTRELGWLVLDSAEAHEIGDEGSARGLFDRAATVTAAELLGVAAASLDMAVAYAKERVQFGKPIGSFQAVKHMLADALVDVEGMRSAAYYAAWCAAAGDPEASVAASMAKAWCSDAARRVTATALQVLGGIGFTWEHDMHLYLKRAQLDGVSFGDAAFHRDRITSLLRERMASGLAVI